MPGQRIPDLTAIAGASTANDDNLVIFDTDANTTKRILRSQLAAGLVGDLPYTPAGFISSTTVPTAIAEIASDLSANSGSNLVGFLQAGVDAQPRTAQAKMRDVVSVLDFGADPTGGTDSTLEIQAAIDYGASSGVRVVGAGTFRISSKVVIKGDADFSQAVFNVYSTPAVAVEISTGSATDPTDNLFNAVIWLPRRIANMTKPSPGWSGQGVGVRTVNTSACQIFVGNVVGFARGLLATSFGAGNSYNNYYFGHLENNQINLDLTPGNSGAWVNENNFFGGRLSHYLSEGTDVAGTRHIYLAAATNPVNNNLFIKPSIEGNTAEFHVECAGSQNTFQQARWEATTPKLRFFGTNTNQGGRNIVLGGFDLQGLIVSTSGTIGGQNSIIGGAEGVVQMGSSGKPLRYQNQGSDASAVRLFYGAAQNPFANGADWSVFESAQELRGKRPADTYPRIKVNYIDGLIYFDNGTTASPTAAIGAFGAGVIRSTAQFWPGSDNSLAFGNSSYRWSNAYCTNVRPGAGTAIWTSGAGTPEGAVTAPVGSLYTRTDGGAGTTLYVKESGTGNTGWVAK